MIFTDSCVCANHSFYIREWTNINCPLHYHYTFEVVFVISGTFTVKKDYKTYILSKNDAIIIMPLEFHEFVTDTQSEISVFELSPNLISNFNQLFTNKTPKDPQFKFSDDELSDIYRRLKYTDNYLLEINCIFFSLLNKALGNTELIPNNFSDNLFKKVLLYINDHFDENICLKDVSTSLNINYVYLSRMFIQKSGFKFNDFLNNLRIQKALSLLVDTSISISEIGYLCGWGSLRNFNRVFLKTMGFTPKEFRQKSVPNKNIFHFDQE